MPRRPVLTVIEREKLLALPVNAVAESFFSHMKTEMYYQQTSRITSPRGPR